MPANRRASFVLPDLGTGGAQRVMISLATALLARGWQVELAALAREATPGRVQVPAGLACVEFGMPSPRRGLGPLATRLAEAPPDLVVSVMGYLNLALLAQRGSFPRSTRVVVREANGLAATMEALPRWVPGALAYRLLYRRADRVIAPTASIASELMRIAGMAAPRLAILPNPVDEAGLRARAAAPRRQPGNGARFVAAGRLTKQKGLDRLVAALAVCPPEARAIIFGEGPERAALEANARARGLEDRLAMPGFSEDLPSWVAGADAFILPSRWEGLPNVALEALALGTPVVATAPAPWLDELVAHAPPGSVRVVEPEALGDVLRGMSPRVGAMPGPSLLPPGYIEAQVHERFARLAEETVRP